MINSTIKHLMIDQGLNQGKLADACGVSATFLCQFLHGRRKSKPTKKKAAEVLGISTQRLARLLRA